MAKTRQRKRDEDPLGADHVPTNSEQLEKAPTGIAGLDEITIAASEQTNTRVRCRRHYVDPLTVCRTPDAFSLGWIHSHATHFPREGHHEETSQQEAVPPEW